MTAGVAGLVDEARAALYEGQPRLFLERLTVIRLETGVMRLLGALEGNQAYYYDASFGQIKHIYDPMPPIVVVKARGALSSTLWVSAMGAFASQVPFWKGAICSNHHKVNAALMDMVETAYQNYPMEARVPLVTDSKEQKEWGHSVEGEVKATSSIQTFSGEGLQALRSQKFNMVLVSELGPMEEIYADILADAAGAGKGLNTWEVTESTPYGREYPSGNKNLFFVRCEAARKGLDVPDVFLLREWYRNPAHHIPRGSVMAAAGNRGELAYTEEERRLVRQFPLDGIEPEGRIRWRRTEIARCIRDKHGNTDLGMAKFLQERVERYESCWAGESGGALPLETFERMRGMCAEPYVDRTVAGIRKRVWKPRVAGHVYVMVQDSAKGTKKGDDSMCKLFDRTTETAVGELWGLVSGDAMQDAAAELAREYGHVWYCPETNGLGEHLPRRAREKGYTEVLKLWKERQRNQETADHFMEREAGWQTGREKRDQGGRLVGALIEAEIGTYCEDDALALNKYNWDDKREHTPERAICFMIYNEIRGSVPKGEFRRPQDAQGQRGERRREIAGSGSGVWGRPSRF